MIPTAFSGFTPPATGPKAEGNVPTQSQTKLQSDIAREVASAPLGADVQVNYRYGRGANGEMVVIGATTTITETKTQTSSPFPEDIIDIRANTADTTELTDAEQAYLKQLQAADAAVRSHEALHFRAAGGLGQLPEFQTITGPDGEQYAVAGHVNVSGTRGADNEKAAREAATLVSAATAPADASAADLSAARQFGIQGDTANDAINAARQAEPKAGGIIDIIA